MNLSVYDRELFDTDHYHDNCGVGFITCKSGVQEHGILELTHESLCTIPHRGGMSSEGVGDGAGVNFDLSVNFFQKLTGISDLERGKFGVGNFFFAHDASKEEACRDLVNKYLSKYNIVPLVWREVPVDINSLNDAALRCQQTINQVIFSIPEGMDEKAFERCISDALIDIEAAGFSDDNYLGFYPLSLSSRTQVLKGRLNSGEVVPYFKDLRDPEMQISIIFFHTRFSTNTAPATMMAQPFRYIAHNGELNTDKKNRLSEDAIAKQNNKKVIFPHGQSDSSRLDQTMARRINEDDLDIVTGVVAMMPPAWENNETLSPRVRAMLEYFSLYEEKNDGPAALIFSNGIQVGARLDRLGLRPLRSVETHDYLAVMSEAGQIDFRPEDVIRRGRIEAGGMLYFDHNTGESYRSEEVLEALAAKEDYEALLEKSVVRIEDLPVLDSAINDDASFSIEQRHVAYSNNQETFKFLLDPMIQNGAEKISAMGYGRATNALTNEEGGMSKYFSQRFAQVTNPPLDSLRETDGMTLRVALGPKPNFTTHDTKQIISQSPLLSRAQLEQIRKQEDVSKCTIDITYTPNFENIEKNEAQLSEALDRVLEDVINAANNQIGLIILSDYKVAQDRAALPLLMVIAACNQRMIEAGVRFNSSLIAESGQVASSHDVATALGFGVSAICPLSVHNRIVELYGDSVLTERFEIYRKATHKSLLKIMGKFGLCTVESYTGGEIFESSYLDTEEPKLKWIFPNINSPVGGARYSDICISATEWHTKALNIAGQKEIPLLGLFKERNEGAGHTFGNLSVREFVNMTQEELAYSKDREQLNNLGIPSWILNGESPVAPEDSHKDFGYRKRTKAEIDSFGITPAYRQFATRLYKERLARPSALRDILDLPADLGEANTKEDFDYALRRQDIPGNNSLRIKGMSVTPQDDGSYMINLSGPQKRNRYQGLADHLIERFPGSEANVEVDHIVINDGDRLDLYMSKVVECRPSLSLDEVQPAHEITPTLTSGAMSHGALNLNAHREVALGTNIAGALSNSGEGGEHHERFDTIYASRIKQVASGRFGIWSGYLADPCLEELEIKIAQGAKPGEGGQLPSKKVTVEIAAARGGTPGIELVSPPPHHDTYSIEDLAQLIHDCKAARVRVIVKLVSSEGIGTIAVGVAKAGADVINVAGNTGGTGAAAVTSLKNTGRSAEIGIAEVHQALAANGLRNKVILRGSGAHQTGLDVVKSAILGADSYEFGTTALMMIGCVMAKNCNIACPAGLTTNPEVFTGDGRKLAQFYLNLAHEVREILAYLGYPSLKSIRGKTELLQLINHESIIGRLDMRALLKEVEEWTPKKAVYLEADFSIDEKVIDKVRDQVLSGNKESIHFEGSEFKLDNNNKTVGGRLGIDIERILNYQTESFGPSVYTNEYGRKYLKEDSVILLTSGSAGQSYGAFSNRGMRMEHLGTCNDGVGKSMTGGRIIVKNPGGGSTTPGENVLVGNFAAFGATGGQLYVAGEAGDRFAVRNSGALAVVEGVGEFGCEYMVNGTVMNLGSFGMGYGNGMSGGIAYQYDPNDSYDIFYNKESIVVQPLSMKDALLASHEPIIKYILERHLEATASEKAKIILSNWEDERYNFRVVIPRALFQQQSAEALEQNMARKEITSELSMAMARLQVEEVRKAWNNDEPVVGGQIPQYGETDTPLMFNLLNRFAVVEKACTIAAKKLKKGDFEVEQVHIDRYSRHLILGLDFQLVDALAKEASYALGKFDDREIAVLLANKRINDYKEALSLRDVFETEAMMGMSAWILHQDRTNREIMTEIPDFEEILATYLTRSLLENMYQQTTA
ncbi:MAG: glutamate synthase-related protein [Lentisphaeria bacterium]|nr:glutamate synthase-related protein [Lentisphaeria bacterium]